MTLLFSQLVLLSSPRLEGARTSFESHYASQLILRPCQSPTSRNSILKVRGTVKTAPRDDKSRTKQQRASLSDSSSPSISNMSIRADFKLAHPPGSRSASTNTCRSAAALFSYSAVKLGSSLMSTLFFCTPSARARRRCTMRLWSVWHME